MGMTEPPGTLPGEGENPQQLFPASERFRLVAFLGRGTVGLVFRAYDRETDTDIALKTLAARQPDQLYQLKQEFRVLSGIRHVNLVELYELMVTGAHCFFTMELVEGSDFVAAHRETSSELTATAALARFAGMAQQLVHGVAAVHAAGRLHRDIKPSNILVTHDGRVVLLDFGLATAFGGDSDADQDTAAFAGTFAYMAPEQAWGKPPHPAADWYSVGVVLYEALAGRLPFQGSRARLVTAKMCEPPLLRTLIPDIPERLDRLVAALLVPDPHRRPVPATILSELQDIQSGNRYIAARSSGGTEPQGAGSVSENAFIGRAAELTALRAAFERMRQGETAVVHVSGPSGIGKTELVRRFVAGLEADGEAIILRGRCHPQESVPYNALDRLIDALSRVLLTLSPGEVSQLIAHGSAALTRLFPVLVRVPGLSAADEDVGNAELHEIRRRGFAALRDLLAALARRRPVVLWIDDVHWADADSISLLRELTRPPDAPPVLLLLTYWSDNAEEVPLHGLLLQADAEGRTQRMRLGTLGAEESFRLAQHLCAAQVDSDQGVAQIVAESGGSPFFISQLSRWLPRAHSCGSLQLADLMRERLGQLSSVARDVLEVVSVAGEPVSRSLALSAAGIGERVRPVVSTLEYGYLLRTTMLGEQATLEVYHDRIREVLIAQMAPARRRSVHRLIADTLRADPEADPNVLFTHYLGADDATLAGQFAVLAGDRAAQTLAFDRAAQLYRQALDLRPAGEERPELLTKLAEALANDGRGLQAAQTFEAAAQVFGAQPGERERTLDLRRQAAEHYLRTGHLDEGLAVTRAVLKAVGVAYPDSTLRAMGTVFTRRVKLLLRGLEFHPRRRDEIAPEMLLRLRACHRVSMSLGVVDLLAADAIGVLHLIEALECGERSQICQALEWEAIKNVQAGHAFLRRRGLRMLERVKELAAETGDVYDLVGVHFAAGAAAYEAAEWREAHQHCDRAAVIARERCTGLRFELVTIDAFSLSALAHMGELRDVALRLPQAIGDSEERGDLYATLGLRAGILNLVWLADDRPGDARRQIDDAIARWPSHAFLLQHYLHLIAAVHADLYTGDVWAAWRRLLEQWPALRKALFLTMASPAVELRNLRARAALAAAAVGAHGLPAGAAAADPHWPRARLLRLAEREARRLDRIHSVASARPFATVVRAGIAANAGRSEEAVRLYAAAAARFAAVEMGLYRAAAEYRQAALLGGDAGHRCQQQATDWMQQQSVRNPGKMASVLCPTPVP